MLEKYKEHDIAAYAGYIKNTKELMECSSGGVATALARQCILQGGYVAGVAYSEDFREARYEIADCCERLNRFKGSKYVCVNKGTIFKDVKTILDEGKHVLFFGLPCTVAGLHTYLRTEYENLITVELICHGPTDEKVHRQYVEYLEKLYNSRITDFSVKRKKNSWTPGYLYAEFENGEIFEKPFYHTEYGYAFSVMGSRACYSCKFKGNNRTGDIMIGDFWGAEPEDDFWNPNGVSSILVHTHRGKAFLQSNDEIKLFPTTFERIVEKNPNVIQSRSDRPERKKFEKLFAEHDLFYSVKHSKRFTTRIKSFIKKHLKPSDI